MGSEAKWGFRVARAAFAMLATLALAPLSAQQRVQTLALKPGQEIIFSAAILDGRVVLGPGRIGKLGTSEPKPGEIAVGVKPSIAPYYAELRVRENSAAPINFVAAMLIGGTKIDEVVVCGRLDAPTAQRIANAAWRIALDRFEPGKEGEACH